MTDNRRAKGELRESFAAHLLETNGYRIVERNWRRKTGEIDIIAEEGGYLVFAEVKYRRTFASGRPEEAVDAAKQRRIRRTAEWYLSENRIPPGKPCRFDVVSIGPEGVRLIKNAFGGL